MIDDDIRAGLRRLAEPGTPPPGATSTIETLVARRRRGRRVVIGAAAAVLVVTAGVGAASLALRGNDAAPGPADRSDGSDGSVSVEVESTEDPAAVPGTARWDGERRELVYVSRLAYSGSCLAEARVTREGGRVDLTLTDGGDVGEDCTSDATSVTAVVGGLDAAPEMLLVADDGPARTVAVAVPGAGFDVRVVASMAAGQSRIGYIEGALTEVTVARAAEPTRTIDAFPPAGAPWERSWLDLEPGRYVVRGAVRPCDGNCGLLDPPTDECERTIDLTSDTRVDVEFDFGQACTIETSPDPAAADAPAVEPLALRTSDWRPGDGGSDADIGGTVRVGLDGCVYLVRDGVRQDVAWPAGWTATIDRARHVVVSDAEGRAVFRDGDQISAGGGYGRFTGDDGACGPGPSSVAVVQSDVTVIPR